MVVMCLPRLVSNTSGQSRNVFGQKTDLFALESRTFGRSIYYYYIIIKVYLSLIGDVLCWFPQAFLFSQKNNEQRATCISIASVILILNLHSSRDKYHFTFKMNELSNKVH